MPLLNKKYLNDLKLCFLKTNFSEADFDFEFPESGDRFVVIRFVHLDNAYLVIKRVIERSSYTEKSTISLLSTTEHTTQNTAYQVIMSPGEYESQQTTRIGRLDAAFEYVQDWCGYIVDEIGNSRSSPDWVEEIKEKARNDLEFNIPDGEENKHFSDNEITNIKKVLAELQNKFTELEKENKVTKTQLENVKLQFEMYKQNAKIMPKGVWASITKNKLVELIVSLAKSKEGKELILGGLKSLIKSD